jgi:patatin-like phospholipase/acyl hydrolase
VAIPSFNTKETSPFTFSYNSYTGEPGFTFVGKNPDEKYGDDEDLHSFVADFELWQVARATSAAPTYFPGGRLIHEKVCWLQ